MLNQKLKLKLSQKLSPQQGAEDPQAYQSGQHLSADHRLGHGPSERFSKKSGFLDWHAQATFLSAKLVS